MTKDETDAQAGRLEMGQRAGSREIKASSVTEDPGGSNIEGRRQNPSTFI